LPRRFERARYKTSCERAIKQRVRVQQIAVETSSRRFISQCLAASSRHASPPLSHALRLRSTFVAGMPPRCRGSFGFRCVRARPNSRFYAELRVGGFRLTLSSYNTPELAARAYDAAAWRFRRPHRDLNFQDIESLEEAEILAPAPSHVNEEDRRRHRQAQHRIAIAKRDEELMRQ
jgi:hypothetical protein